MNGESKQIKVEERNITVNNQQLKEQSLKEYQKTGKRMIAQESTDIQDPKAQESQDILLPQKEINLSTIQEGSQKQAQKKKKTSGESVHTVSSISTSNKIAYDNSIDEFSRQNIPSENDMSKGVLKVSNANNKPCLKSIPEMSPFKSIGERNTPSTLKKQQINKQQNMNSLQQSYSKINNNTVCIDKLEFKISQPKKENSNFSHKHQNNIFWNKERLITHSQGDKLMARNLDLIQNSSQFQSSQQNHNLFYKNESRRHTTAEYLKTNGQRITISESPKKSFRYTKIFANQPLTKDSSSSFNSSFLQLPNNNSSSIGLNTHKNVLISNINNQDNSSIMERKKSKETYCIVRQKSIPDTKDSTLIQTVAQKVMEISKNQQEYLQNIQKQSFSPLARNSFNQLSQQKQQQHQFIPQQLQPQQNAQQINSYNNSQYLQNTPYSSVNQQLQQNHIHNSQPHTHQPQLIYQQQQQSAGQYYSQQPSRNTTLQQIFVPLQQNFISQSQQQQGFQQLNQYSPMFQNNSIDKQMINVSLSSEHPQKFCSTGSNPYSYNQRRIFTDSSNSPKINAKANSIRLYQGRASSGSIQLTSNNTNNNSNQQIQQCYTESSEQKPILLLNQEAQLHQNVNQINNEAQQIQPDLNQKLFEQRRSTQGRIKVTNDGENMSSQNSFGNPNKFVSAGIGARFSFCKTFNSQQEIQSSSLQENNPGKDKSQTLAERQSLQSYLDNGSLNRTLPNQVNPQNEKQLSNSLNNSEEVNQQYLTTEKSTAAGCKNTIQTEPDQQINTNGMTTLQSFKQQYGPSTELIPALPINLLNKLSVDRSSQRKSLSSCGRSSVYSPLRNYFKENPLINENKQLEIGQEQEDKLGITPVSMMRQQMMPSTTPEDFLRRLPSKDKKDHGEKADPLEMYPSQYEPPQILLNNDNKQKQNNINSISKELSIQGSASLKEGQHLRENYMKSIEDQELDYLLVNNHNTVSVMSSNHMLNNRSRSCSSSKKFALERLKLILTSDTKNAECNLYIDEYTSLKNRELLLKQKSRIQRNNSTKGTSSSVDHQQYERIQHSIEKSPLSKAQNNEYRISQPISQNNSSWNQQQIHENNLIQLSVETQKVTTTLNNSIFQKLNTSQATPINQTLHYQNNKDKNEAGSVKPFTVSSLMATPIITTKQMERGDCQANSFSQYPDQIQNQTQQQFQQQQLIQPQLQQVKQNTISNSNQAHNLFLEKQQAFQNLPASKMTSDNDENAKFQKNMLLSAQPQAKQNNEEIESKRTQLESDRQAPPALLLQTCVAYEGRSSPMKIFKQSTQIPNQSIYNTNSTSQNNANFSQQNNTNSFQLKNANGNPQQNHCESNKQGYETEQFQRPPAAMNSQKEQIINKQIFENKQKESNNNNFININAQKQRSVSQAAIFSNDINYTTQINSCNNGEQKQEVKQNLPITNQLQEKYNQIIQTLGQKNDAIMSQLNQKQALHQDKFIDQNPQSLLSQSYSFMRKNSATELSRSSNSNTQNYLNQSVELKRKSLYLPPKPQLHQSQNGIQQEWKSIQNQSYDDIRKETSLISQQIKNQVLKNPKSIKDSIINGRTSVSQISSSYSSEDAKISDLIVQSVISPKVKLSDFYNNKQPVLSTTSFTNHPEKTEKGNLTSNTYKNNFVEGERLDTFEDTSQFQNEVNQTPNNLFSLQQTSEQFMQQNISNKQQYSILDREIGGKIIPIRTEPHFQEEDKENTYDSFGKTNNFPLFTEFFSSIQKEYQKSLRDHGQQSVSNECYNSYLSTKEVGVSHSEAHYNLVGLTKGNILNTQGMFQKGYCNNNQNQEDIIETKSNIPLNLQKDIVSSSSIFSHLSKQQQIDQKFNNSNKEKHIQQGCAQSWHANTRNQPNKYQSNSKSYQQTKTQTEPDSSSSIFNKSNTTIPQNEQQTNHKIYSDMAASVIGAAASQNKMSSNVLKEQSQNNIQNNDNSYQQSKVEMKNNSANYNQQQNQGKQKVFEQGVYRSKQKQNVSSQENDISDSINKIKQKQKTNGIFQQQRAKTKNKSNGISSSSYSNSNNNSNLNGNQIHIINNNNNHSNHCIQNNSNNTSHINMLIQYPKSSSINSQVISNQHSNANALAAAATVVHTNNQTSVPQSSVPTQQSLQNNSNNISKITESSNSKLIQIFLANQQLDQLTGGNNKVNQQNATTHSSQKKERSYLQNLLCANQQLAQSIQTTSLQQKGIQSEYMQQNCRNFCLNCKALVSPKEFASHVHNCNSSFKEQLQSKPLKNGNTTVDKEHLKINEELQQLTQNEQTQQLSSKLIECNKNLEIVKVQAYQKLHSGEQFQVSRLCLYVNFFIECLNLIIINNQSYKELKSSLNDLTAIMEKITISGEDEQTEQFLVYAHKGYEIGLHKLGIIKRLK